MAASPVAGSLPTKATNRAAEAFTAEGLRSGAVFPAGFNGSDFPLVALFVSGFFAGLFATSPERRGFGFRPAPVAVSVLMAFLIYFK
jgi:hypothetical protein